MELQVHINFLQERRAVLRELDALDAVDDDGLEEEMTAAQEYEENICYMVTRVRCARSTQQQVNTRTSPAPPSAEGPSDPRTNAGDSPSPSVPNASPVAGALQSRQPELHQGKQRTVTVSRLQMPTSSGRSGDWMGLWDHYKVTIHSNDALPKIEKFKYLIMYLANQAKEAIEGIRISELNYDIAIRILQERFGRNDSLVDEHLDNLLTIPPVRSSNVAALRDLYDRVQARTNSLDGLRVPPTQYAVLRFM